MDTIEVMNYFGGPGEYDTLRYNDRTEREYVIYKEIISFLQNIRKKFKKTPNMSMDFDDSLKGVLLYDESFNTYSKYEECRLIGFESFLKLIIKKGSIEVLKIKNSTNQKEIIFEIIKCKGDGLTNYSIDVNFDRKEKLKIIIGHDGYEFRADGVPEHDERLMGQLHYEFFNNVSSKLREFFGIKYWE